VTDRRGFFAEIAYIVDRYGEWLLRGAGVTILLAIVGTLIGIGIGLVVGTVRTIPNGPHDAGPVRRALLKVVNALLAVYIEVFRGTPMIVQAVVIYYGLKEAIGLDLGALQAGFLIVSINTGAYMAEIVRGGIQSVDPGQTEAGEAVGMTHWQIMRGVVLPQTIRNILPATGNEFVINIKDTSVLMIISVTELFFQGKSIQGITYRSYEVYLVVAIIYLVLTFTTTRVLRLLERRMAGPKDFTLATSQTMPESILHAGPDGTAPIIPAGRSRSRWFGGGDRW